MKWLSNASVDELGNSLIKSYMGEQTNNKTSVDIEGFVKDYLKLPVIYRRFAEEDMSKLGFISDGLTPLSVYINAEKKQTVFPKGTIVIEEYLRREQELGRCRFTIAHEAAHYVIDKSLSAASFHREFDSEKTYSAADLKEIFNIKETNVDRLAGALLMPEFRVRNYLNRGKRSDGIAVYDNGFIRPEDHMFLQWMATNMGASLTALQIRIRELGLYIKKPMNEYLSELGLGKEMAP